MAKMIPGLTTVAAMPSGAGQAAHLAPEVGKQPPKRLMIELDYAKAEMIETVGVIGYIEDIRFVEGAWVDGVDGLAEPEPTPTLKIGNVVRVVKAKDESRSGHNWPVGTLAKVDSLHDGYCGLELVVCAEENAPSYQALRLDEFEKI